MAVADPSAPDAPARTSPAKRADGRGAEVAAWLLVLASFIASTVINHQFVRPLGDLYDGIGEPFPWPLRVYVGMTHFIALWMLFGVALIALAIARSRAARTVLFVMAALATANTMLGLWSVADTGVGHAMRLETWNAEALLERDLAAAHLAAGRPQEVIALIDPAKKGDLLAIQGVWAAGRAFQLAEAYRMAGDLEVARRLYRRIDAAAATLSNDHPRVTRPPGMTSLFTGSPDWADYLLQWFWPDPVPTELEQRKSEIRREQKRMWDVLRASCRQRLDRLETPSNPKE